MPRAVDTRQLKIEHDPTLNGNEFHLQIRARQEQMLAEMWKTLAEGAYKTVVDIIKDLTGIDLSTWESFLTGMMPQFPNLSIEKVIDDAGDNIQDFFDGVVSTLLGGFRFGQTGNQAVSAIGGVNTTAVTAQYTVRTLQTIYALRSQRPLWQTVDGSAECSVPIVISENLINVTSATIKGGFIRCQGGEEKTSVTFAGYKTGTISSAYLDIYRLETNGSMTLLYSSPDWSSELQTAAALYQHVFAEEDQKGILTELGDNYGIQFRVGGSGTLVLRGRTMTPIAPLAGFRPLRLGFSRPSGTPAPPTISAATMDTLYTDDIPFIGFGGIDEILPRSLFDPFTDTKVRYVYRSLQTGIGFFDTQPVISNGLMSFSGFTDGLPERDDPDPHLVRPEPGGAAAGYGGNRPRLLRDDVQHQRLDQLRHARGGLRAGADPHRHRAEHHHHPRHGERRDGQGRRLLPGLHHRRLDLSAVQEPELGRPGPPAGGADPVGGQRCCGQARPQSALRCDPAGPQLVRQLRPGG